MSYGICTLSVVPCRAEPNDRAEIVTQLLFGEHYTVIEEQEKWIKIRIQYDHYEAWICRKQFTEINNQEFDELSLNEFDLVGEYFGEISNQEKGKSMIPIGATLPFLHQGKFKIRQETYSYKGQTAKKDFNSLEAYALNYLNSPYLWGGKSPAGIDCSGYTQLVYKLCGYKLPRDAYQQAKQGETVGFVESAKIGDLAFFDNAEGDITHVGIILNDGKIIHASGKVRIDLIDHQGIYHQELKNYTHQLRIIKRYFD
jgi:hypothetical protein